MAEKYGNFTFYKTAVDGVIIAEPTVYGDSRGYFCEEYCKRDFFKGGITADFVQQNHSLSKKGVLRGLHYQKNYSQAKLVRCIRGEVFDVAVDLRPESKTFGKYESVLLSAENKKQFFIPKGFAHGFYVLSEEAEFLYMTDEYYHPEEEAGIIWNDPNININWPLQDGVQIKLSDKDKKYPMLKEVKNQL